MNQHRERGATIVEAALVLLMLVTLMFAVFDFARALNVYQALTNAAREGARYAVAPAQGGGAFPTTTAVQTKVNAYLDSANITDNMNRDVNVSTCFISKTSPVCHNPAVNVDDRMYTQVQVSADYDSFFVPGLNVTLSTEARMRNENQD